MLKKIIALGVVSIMGIMMFCGCNSDNLVEENAEFFKLGGWSLCISYYHNRIEAAYDDPDIRLALYADKGKFYVGGNADFQRATLNSGEMAAWIALENAKPLDVSYIDVMVKAGYRIIGYAVIKIINGSDSYEDSKAEIIKSVAFPKINGKYQRVSIFEVKKRIAAAKK